MDNINDLKIKLAEKNAGTKQEMDQNTFLWEIKRQAYIHGFNAAMELLKSELPSVEYQERLTRK